jgi:hypothetical protein
VGGAVNLLMIGAGQPSTAQTALASFVLLAAVTGTLTQTVPTQSRGLGDVSTGTGFTAREPSESSSEVGLWLRRLADELRRRHHALSLRQ